jgi:predicted TIM-barrel fold metal-dependent hydrolase
MRIDLHAHVAPPVDAVREAVSGGAGIDGLPPSTTDALLESMEWYGIDAAVLSMPLDFRPERSVAITRSLNEGLAQIVRDHPDRLAAVATLPQRNVDASLDELGYALDVLGLDGVALLTHAGGTYLGDSSLDPLMQELDDRGAYVFVHPWFPPHELPVPAYGANLFEFPQDTTRAVVNLVFSGTLERFPRIRFQLSHLGGTLPFLAQRIAMFGEQTSGNGTQRIDEHAPEGFVRYLERLFYDTAQAAYDRLPFDLVADLVGLDQIVFGTDWPVVHMIKSNDPSPGLAGLDPAIRARVDAGNAAKLVPRLSAAVAERLAG